jgi:hypothetical protein
MPTALRNVRSQGQSGKHMLAGSFSGFDPKRTLHALNALSGHRRRRADQPVREIILVACTVALEQSGIQTIEQRTCSTGEARAALAMTRVELPQFAATIVFRVRRAGLIINTRWALVQIAEGCAWRRICQFQNRSCG